MAAESLFVQCGLGLEPALESELKALGLSPRVETGGCAVDGPPGTFERLNLWSRVANRVLLRLGEVKSPDELARLPWARVLPRGAGYEVKASGERAGGWEAQLGKVLGPSSGEVLVSVYLRGQGGRCAVSVDTSGELLHFRGYRQEVGRAPMRETLAAAMLRLADWKPGEPLWDLMCGSGTLVIEAAEQVKGLAPGRNRAFAFERFPGHDAARWKAWPRQQDAVASPIRGTDLNAGALGTARRNARRAGVGELLSLERLDATKPTPWAAASTGLLVANLPYGKRVGERSELGRLYQALGHALLQNLRGWRFCFLLEEGSELLLLPLRDRVLVSNGGLSCEMVMGRVP